MMRFIFSFVVLSLCFSAVGGDEIRVLKVGQKPESVCRGFGGKLFVTVIEGEEPGDGGINRLDGDNVTEFCRGMNSPKGMAFVGGFLIVADETSVWKVDQKGRPSILAKKDDFPAPIEFLNDVAASRDGKSVYVTEMSHPKWMFDPDGERKLWPVDNKTVKPPMTGCVYRVSLDGKITLRVPAGNQVMPGPNGVTVGGNGNNELLVMADFFTGNIVSHDGKNFRVIASGMRGADGVALGQDAIYVSSWSLGKVWKVDRKTKSTKVLAKDFTTAADFYYDRKNSQLIIPDMLEGTLTFLKLQ